MTTTTTTTTTRMTIKARLARLVERVLDQFFVRFDIGRRESPYMTRWTLWGKRFEGDTRVFLHRFHRSDSDTLHDHPWLFTSLVLWPGYYEETPGGRRRWYGPLSLLRRPATWVHRVFIPKGRGCWTLVVAGKKTRKWGFHCAEGFKPFDQFLARAYAGLDPCGETP